jgi:hypothetical protein
VNIVTLELSRSTGQTMAQPLEPATPFLHMGETDCVADDTVLIGPVSPLSNSLLAGNLQGIFEYFRLIRQFSSPFSE